MGNYCVSKEADKNDLDTGVAEKERLHFLSKIL